jgi:nicotinate dehydrogenase subunit B
LRGVLETAARKFAWMPAKAPSGRGVGVSCGIDSGTYMATMVEVSVDKKTGQAKAKRVVFAHDQGPTVSPSATKLKGQSSWARDTLWPKRCDSRTARC